MNVTVSMLVPELKNVSTVKAVGLGVFLLCSCGFLNIICFIVQCTLNQHLTFTLLSV